MGGTDQLTEWRRQGESGLLFRKIAVVFVIGLMVAAVSGVDAFRAASSVVEPAAAERINPNTATVPSLMRLPGVGRVRAMDIAAGRDRAPFQRAADLERIRGIGPKTVDKIKPYLVFEE